MTDPTPQTTPTRDEAVLLPCPFCGGANLKARVEDIDGWIAHIECTDCDDMTGPMSEFKYPEKSDAIADASRVWNRRASAPAPASGGVVVKALEWREEEPDWWSAEALTWKSGYEAWKSPYGVVRWRVPGDAKFSLFDGTLEEAKAACEAAYDKLIRSALSPAATPVSEAKAIGREMADEIDGGLATPPSADKPYAQFRAEHLAKPASSPAGGDVRDGALGWNSPEEWEIEQRAFHAAGRDDVPKDVQELVAILWKQYCIAAEPRTQSPVLIEQLGYLLSPLFKAPFNGPSLIDLGSLVRNLADAITNHSPTLPAEVD